MRIVALELANRRVRIGERGVGAARREVDRAGPPGRQVLEQGRGLRIPAQTDGETLRLIPAAQGREREDLVPGDPGHARVSARGLGAVPAVGQPEHLLERAGPEHRLGEEQAGQPFVLGVPARGTRQPPRARARPRARAARAPLELPLEHPDRRAAPAPSAGSAEIQRASSSGEVLSSSGPSRSIAATASAQLSAASQCSIAPIASPDSATAGATAACRRLCCACGLASRRSPSNSRSSGW